MKKAFALILLLALVLTGCGIPADVPDPTENSYPLHPTPTTQTEATTVPAETESEMNEFDTTKETEAATEPTVPSTSEPTAEATNPTEGSQETIPPKQTPLQLRCCEIKQIAYFQNTVVGSAYHRHAHRKREKLGSRKI